MTKNKDLFDYIDDEGIPSAHDSSKRYYPKFDGTRWICQCEHYKIYKTPCRHILIKQLEKGTDHKNDGVQNTSIESYMSLLSEPYQLNKKYQQIIKALTEIGKPSTDLEITIHLNFHDPNKIRPRRNELSDQKGKHFYQPLIRTVGKRKCNISHKQAYIWDLTEEGRAFASFFNYI